MNLRICTLAYCSVGSLSGELLEGEMNKIPIFWVLIRIGSKMDINKLKVRIIDLLFSRALVYMLLFELRGIRASLDLIKDELKLNAEASSRESSSSPMSLNHHEYRVYSQSGEDGIITEIFNRIGTANKFFVEFGAGSGVENNTAFLLIKSWSGFWIEGDSSRFKTINQKFGFLIGRSLKAVNTFVNAENIESILRENRVPQEFDLLSIDIDGNDFWVWNAISWFKPRVVVIEYNSIFPPDIDWIIKYNPNLKYNRYTSFFGASLKALEKLGTRKGYTLVACESTGVNAFFVRSDLIGEKFKGPYNASNFYSKPAYSAAGKIGHASDFGEYTSFEDYFKP
jgi:hypothetical protein